MSLELKLKSPAGSNPLIYTWPFPHVSVGKSTCDLIDTIRWVGREVDELNIAIRNLINDCDITSYDSVKNLCDKYNRAIDGFLQLRKGLASEPSGPCSGLLKHILQQCYMRAVREPEKLNQYEPFSPEVYGETSYELVEQMLKYIKKDFGENCLFIDLGSGVGQVVLQVSGSVSIKKCIGIEKADYPTSCAESMQTEFKKLMKWYGKIYTDFQLLKGDFVDEEFRNLITEADVVFVNNFAFGPQIDHELKERFKDMKEGAKIVSSKSFCPLNFRISDRALHDVASILNVEELTPMSGNVSWTCKPVTFTLHTVNRSMLEEYFKSLKNPSLRDDDKIVRKDRRGRIVGPYTNGIKINGEPVNEKTNIFLNSSERRHSTSSTDKTKHDDLFGPTTRRQWNEWVRTNSTCQASSNEDNDRSQVKENTKNGRKRRKGRQLLSVSNKKLQTKAQKKKALNMEALSLFHNHTLMSQESNDAENKASDLFNYKSMIKSANETEIPALSKSGTEIANVCQNKLNVRLPEKLVDAVNQFYDLQKQQTLSFFKSVKTEEYKTSLKMDIRNAQEKNTNLKQTKEKLEKLCEVLTKDGLDKLKNRLAECRISAISPADFTTRAKEIVTRFKSLHQRLEFEQQTVNGLDQERIKLLEMRNQEQKSILSNPNNQQENAKDYVENISSKSGSNTKASISNSSIPTTTIKNSVSSITNDTCSKTQLNSPEMSPRSREQRQRQRLTMKLDIRQPDKIKVLGAKSARARKLSQTSIVPSSTTAVTKSKSNITNDPYNFSEADQMQTTTTASLCKSDHPVARALLSKPIISVSGQSINRVVSGTKRTSISPNESRKAKRLAQKSPGDKSRPSSNSSTLSAESNPSVPTSPRAKLLQSSKTDHESSSSLVDHVKNALLPHDRSKPAFASSLMNPAAAFLQSHNNNILNHFSLLQQHYFIPPFPSTSYVQQLPNGSTVNTGEFGKIKRSAGTNRAKLAVNGVVKQKQPTNGWDQISTGLDVLFSTSSSGGRSSGGGPTPPNGDALNNSMGSSCGSSIGGFTENEQDNDSTKYDKHFKKKLFMRSQEASKDSTESKFRPKGKNYPKDSDSNDSMPVR